MPAFIRQHPARFWRWHLGLPLLLGLLLWQVYPATGLDDLIEHWYYDPAARAFLLRDVLWLTAGAHSGLKMLVIAVGLAAFFAWLASFFTSVVWTEAIAGARLKVFNEASGKGP